MPGVAAAEELSAAVNDVLARYPNRRELRGTFRRSRDDTDLFVLSVTFRNKATVSLEYDISRWVAYVRKHG
jgi:hypothetical protein